MVDEGKTYSLEKQFENPLHEKCCTHEEISVIDCHCQPQILNLKGSFILFKGNHAVAY